jgi:hypothetical protein
MVSLSVLLLSWNSPSLRISSDFFSASDFSASASLASRVFWEVRRVSSSEEAAARDEDAPAKKICEHNLECGRNSQAKKSVGN